jgi:hypothetical protein
VCRSKASTYKMMEIPSVDQVADLIFQMGVSLQYNLEVDLELSMPSGDKYC